jgi:eukaryotic-like serine/threonine-protein kinase
MENVSSEPLFDEVAAAILDGTAIDWTGVDSRVGREDQPLIEQLKTLATLRLVSRRQEARVAAPDYWGHLRVLERIGTGAFGEVFRAWDTRLDREVALKLLSSDTLGPDSHPSSIIEEGRLLARIRHPNVVTIYGAERIDGRIGLWMEFVKGRTLEQAVRDGKTFTAKEVTRIGVDLCGALSAVHAAGLVHRDVKAQNVMAADDGRLVLMDFGTGIELDTTSDRNTAGTPLYLAPEVLGGGAADARSDVYSIGVVLYRLLTGSYPVEARDLADLRRAHTAREGSSLPAGVAIPPRLLRVIGHALDPNPDRRYGSADALAAALAALDRARVTVRIAYAVAAAAAVVGITTLAWKSGVAPTARATRSAASAAIARSAPTIAVLPFKNLSSEPDSDYFVDGLTSEVIRNLAVIDGLQVRSQTSSFFFKDRPRDLHTVGEQLGVNLIVEADVQRVGNRLRINAQLVQIDGDVPLWSERFDRTLDDVFAIQDEISRAIVNKLRLTLGKGQRRYQTSAAAYERYLRARALIARRETARAQQAAQLFEQVIASDAAFAPAHAGLADAYAAMSWEISSGISLERGLTRMRAAAVRALELDPLLAEAHAAMGITYARERDWANATKSFERALELNPTLTQIHAAYSGSTLIPLAQTDKAQQLLVAALKVDPLSLQVRRELAMAQFVAGRYEDAIANWRFVLAADPEASHQMLARALTAAGRPAEAIAIWENRPATAGDWERWITRAYVLAGRRADVERLVEAHRNEHPYRQALIYAALGDKDRTFEALNRAVELVPHRTAFTLACPEMALLRGDPRLDALRKTLNLP